MESLTQVGLTGGIASGKTTAAASFARRGAAVIDTDSLAHRTLERGTATYDAVVQTFGRDILDGDGAVNRARLGEIVFADAAQRQQLNAIVHPAVREAWLAALDDLRRRNWRGMAVVVIPLLYEVDAGKMFDAVVTVACSEQTQRRRLRERGLTDAQAGARIAAQWPLTKKADRADYVIWNESPLPVLDEQVARVVQRIESRTGQQ